MTLASKKKLFPEIDLKTSDLTNCDNFILYPIIFEEK